MKITFKLFEDSDISTPAGTLRTKSGPEIEVTRLAIEAYTPTTSNNPPAVRLVFHLTNGETYDMLMMGHVHKWAKNSSETNSESSREKTKSTN